MSEPPTAHRPPPPTTAISRRGFLGSAAAAAWGWGGCMDGANVLEGGIVGPDHRMGHRMRDRGFPAPESSEKHRVVIVGGGIAALAAGRELTRQGVRDFVLLELESETGGNSCSGINGVSAHPWGAHYLPLPGASAPEVLRLLAELGVISGHDSRHRPVYREEFLCHDPAERLFVQGRWQEGLIPQLGLDQEEREQVAEFLQRMEGFRRASGGDGLPAFAIPVDRSSADPELRALDRITMASWLEREGFRATPLLRYVDYCCRDDFGSGIAKVSAWAGIHYFAARSGVAANAPTHSVLTWPEGNGWLASRLRAGIPSDRLRTGHAVFAIRQDGRRAEVDVYDAVRSRSVRIEAEAVVMAAPRFVCRRLQGLPPDPLLLYPPWMVANLTLRSIPESRGMPLCWDNVIEGSSGLGYVDATHQVLRSHRRKTVWSYYRPLDQLDPLAARTEALKTPWADWRDLTLEDLSVAHPDLRRHVERIDVKVWGHGMIAPSPGFLWGHRLAAMTEREGVLCFAHSDMSGISLFEEAFIRGLRAAEAVLRQLETPA